MPHTYARNTLHVVFSTKNRRAAIPIEFQPEMWAYAAGVCQKIGITVFAIGGIDNHMHLLLQIPAALAVAKAVSTIKSNTSRWANERGRRFAWQEGYGAFSVSQAVIPAVTRYIQNQRIHHRKIDFEAEYVGFLKKHQIEFDPKFAFD
ncbi:MAG TPA: IS200/IS605 family transposase [Candidatus Acidoferrales bacterium]|nr:IS200/IS605 family transposase [Candidatus Acidoferrales bacterium]